ncbi:MAG: AAA family ATPase [Candidatus Margulisbacteria bacterium]|nr:AAA family ATPase [Candidatus Margulisiibacteriota bacterium]
MICQICNKRNATITLQTNINGVNKTLHICQECAKEKNHLLFPKPFIDSLAKQQNLPPFLDSLLKQFSQPSFDKVYGMFSEHANKSMYIAQEECKRLEHGLLDTGHMLLGLLKEKGIVTKYFESEKIDVAGFILEIETALGKGQAPGGAEGEVKLSPRAKKVVELSYNAAKEMQSPYVGPEHLLIGLLREAEGIAFIYLTKRGVSINTFLQFVQKEMPDKKEKKEEDINKFFNNFFAGQDVEAKKPEQSGSDIFEQFGRDLTKLAQENKLDPVIGRENEIKRIIRILSRRTKNNPVLIGDPGVGKTAIVEGLAQEIVNEEVPENLIGKKVIELQLSSVIAGTRFRGDFEDRLKRLLEEATRKDSNIILFIDELHTIIGAGAVGENSLDAANILKPALARGEIQCIGATTIDEYRRYVEKDAALERRFQKIDVSEPSKEETIDILKGLRDKYEAFHRVDIDEDIIAYAVEASSRYITDRFLPDKAIDIIDEAAAMVRLDSISLPEHIKRVQKELVLIKKEEKAAVKNQEYEKAAEYRDSIERLESWISEEKEKWMAKKGTKVVRIEKEDISKVVSDWTKIPLTSLQENELDKYSTMEDALKKNIIGQEEAIEEISRVLKRARSGLKNPDRPIGSFVFAGPTGVGKTELAKVLTEYLMGDKDKLLRYDMSEYMEKFNISKLIGAPPGYVGYDEAGQLTAQVRRNAYSIILFDEIEKAHPEIFNILLQILDNGFMTDSQGRKIDFRNTTIIMTTNMGSDQVKAYGFNKGGSQSDYETLKANVQSEIKKNFKVEFINRLNGVIVFKPLGFESMSKIFDLLIQNIIERLQEKNIKIKISKSVKEKLIKESEYDEFGARSLGRIIEKSIEDPLAHKLLKKEIKGDQTVSLKLSSHGEIIFSIA